MDLWLVKTICIISLLFLTLLCGLLPIKVSQLSSTNGTKGAFVLVLLHCLSGGVFLGTFLLHLLPEAVMITHQVLPQDVTYPVAETIAALGMLLMLLLEEVLFMISKKQEKRIRRNGIPLPEPTILNLAKSGGEPDVMDDVTDKNDVTAFDASKTYGSVEDFGADTTNLTESEEHQKQQQAECHRKLEKTRVVVLVTALSVHSLFEGLAMGLQNTNSAVWTLFLAIATHKSVIAFSTGLQISKTLTSLKPVVVSICVLSVMSPFGATVGTVIISIIHSHDDKSLGVMNAALQSIASGTFMYITFFEILVKSVATGSSGITTCNVSSANSLARLGAVVIGFLIMAGLAFLHH